MENQNSSRVYINPNLIYINPNRGMVRNNQSFTNLPNINAMHLNPNFPSTQNKKIYINPNFIPSVPHPVQGMDPSHSWKTNEKITSNITQVNTRCASTVTMQNKPSHIQTPVTNVSRYRLVRHNENRPPEPKPEKAESLTVNLSKYKSVRIADVKSRLDRVKQPVQQCSSNKYTQSCSQINVQTHGENITNTSNKAIKTQYPFTKRKESKKAHKHQSANMSVRRTPKIKIRKLKLKCNKPCRLFRKYGKCMRNAMGYCKYLHDKKQVSICRKFLKGVCHDKDCLLSHELSDKKMPTCYFYLQGMCTKEGCPYLHVKVNEKAIVCPEFKKGYCEKGSTCLYRHVETTKKRKKKVVADPKIKYSNKTYIRVSDDSKKQNFSVSGQKKEIMLSAAADETTVTDCRYYKEAILEENKSESCEVIKPSRCKLGTLPSFIKL